jgi:hypothetical protein
MSGSRADVARRLLDVGILEFLIGHFRDMVFPDHQAAVAMLLRNLFLLQPAQQTPFLRSPLARVLVEDLTEKTFAEKKAILMLFCGLTRDIGLYAQFFVELRLVDAYVDALEAQSGSLRRAVVASLVDLLRCARQAGHDEFEEILALCQ